MPCQNGHLKPWHLLSNQSLTDRDRSRAPTRLGVGEYDLDDRRARGDGLRL